MLSGWGSDSSAASSGPGFMTYLAITKTLDCMPLHRLETVFKRSGVPLSRSTMNDLYHRVGSSLGLLADHILGRVTAAEIVLTDATPLRTQVNADNTTSGPSTAKRTSSTGSARAAVGRRLPMSSGAPMA